MGLSWWGRPAEGGWGREMFATGKAYSPCVALTEIQTRYTTVARMGREMSVATRVTGKVGAGVPGADTQHMCDNM